MKVTFLGTGTSQGVPPVGCNSPVCLSTDPRDKRLRCSVHIETHGLSIVIDAGPDFRYQLLRAGITRLDALIFTHEHRDHTAGLDDIRPFNYMQNGPVPVYLHKRVLDVFHRQYDYIFAEKKYPGIPEIEWHLIENTPFHIAGLEIIPIEVMHYRLPVLGYRLGDFTYITDANYIHPDEMEKAAGSRHLVLNALRHEPHISHFTLEQAVEHARKIGARNTWFTHMSHQIGFHAQVNETLPEGMALAWDGLVLEW
ncbi:MAG: MBL fold metallo-hydrolase [Bacteroidetes bacterium]|nr:MBL fold metallo-hydrolase [Bacteroidota bacterium]